MENYEICCTEISVGGNEDAPNFGLMQTMSNHSYITQNIRSIVFNKLNVDPRIMNLVKIYLLTQELALEPQLIWPEVPWLKQCSSQSFISIL